MIAIHRFNDAIKIAFPSGEMKYFHDFSDISYGNLSGNTIRLVSTNHKIDFNFLYNDIEIEGNEPVDVEDCLYKLAEFFRSATISGSISSHPEYVYVMQLVLNSTTRQIQSIEPYTHQFYGDGQQFVEDDNLIYFCDIIAFCNNETVLTVYTPGSHSASMQLAKASFIDGADVLVPHVPFIYETPHKILFQAFQDCPDKMIFTGWKIVLAPEV